MVLRSKPRNCHGDFVVQITKLQQPVLRPNWEKSSILVLRLNQETRSPHLLVHSANRTQRLPTSRSSDHRLSDLCLTILVLCTKSPTPISILIATRHAAPVTYTSRDKQTRFSTQKDSRLEPPEFSGFKFKPRQVNYSSQIKPSY
jgi:hypothetical protein